MFKDKKSPPVDVDEVLDTEALNAVTGGVRKLLKDKEKETQKEIFEAYLKANKALLLSFPTHVLDAYVRKLEDAFMKHYSDGSAYYCSRTAITKGPRAREFLIGEK